MHLHVMVVLVHVSACRTKHSIETDKIATLSDILMFAKVVSTFALTVGEKVSTRE